MENRSKRHIAKDLSPSSLQLYPINIKKSINKSYQGRLTKMKKKIIIGSGGTGGHMFPAAAVAKSLKELGYDIILITDKRGMRYGNDFKDDIIIQLPVANIRQGGIFNKIKRYKNDFRRNNQLPTFSTTL